MTIKPEKFVKTDLPFREENLCFIEQQFPVAKVSMESYKERKAGASQTLVGLGNWKGRKPLVLIRAVLLGLLLPVTDYPEKDRDIFLKIMTMDPDGLWQRKYRSIPQDRLLKELKRLPPSVQQRFLSSDDSTQIDYQDRAMRGELQKLVFERMSYDEKLSYCQRPEQIDGPSPDAWEEINSHLETHASSLQELIRELGTRRFGKAPVVGDAFCGGGSIPFEAARMGCPAYGSDLNPIGAFLTWASLNLVGGGPEVAAQLQAAQEEVFQQVDRQICEWGIEHNSLGWRADAYLYCLEVINPEDGWRVPLLPTLAIAPNPKTIARLIPDPETKSYQIEIVEGVSNKEYKQAQSDGTVRASRLYPPNGGVSLPIDNIRRELRQWENKDVVPRSEDVFQERLYCIRWIEKIERSRDERHYRTPTNEDINREQKVLRLLKERFKDWQQKGYLPSIKIKPGEKTDEPIRTRGWTYWHHLFTPRQLLTLGCLSEGLGIYPSSKACYNQVKAGLLAGLGKCVDLNSRLSRWHSGRGTIEQALYNQAFNTFYNYANRGLLLLKDHFIKQHPIYNCASAKAFPLDARLVTDRADIWITDPPYADAINYDEVSEFFLAWQAPHLKKIFPEWPTDSRRELAVRGTGDSFKQSMVDCYQQLTRHMPDDGLQVVMFTHQDAAVWADLSLILWAAGLRVTAAWTIATETESVGIKKGNNVQGTVILVLRKRIDSEPVFLDEISPKVEREVRRQIDEMSRLEDDSDPNFADADYQLAAYAAALRVLTEKPIVEINPEREISLTRGPGEESLVEALINRAVKIACDHLVPRNLDPNLWRLLSPVERFYFKGLEVESHGEYRSGVYQELARGYGVPEYTLLLESSRANETRLKTASEFGRKHLSGDGFSGSLLRQCLFAIAQTADREDVKDGLNYLHTEWKTYWSDRERIIKIITYISDLRTISSMPHWQKNAKAAVLLAGAMRNDHI